MSDKEKDATTWSRLPRQPYEVSIGFKKRPPKRHPILDMAALVFAAALLATVVNLHDHGEGPVTFAVLSALFILLYVGGWNHPPAQGGKH